MPTTLKTGVVFASPHSGCDYDDAFLAASDLDKATIRSSEDAFVDRLYADVVKFGAPLLQATAPRAFLDLNRAPEELDPALIQDVKRKAPNSRVHSGLGVIPRVVANGRSIYSGKLTKAEALQRITDYWVPYHDQLQILLDRARMKFGEAVLIDCHSMPSEAVAPGGIRTHRTPQVVLGDRFGAAASGRIMDQVEAAFQRAGFRVSRNAPFAGAFITQNYGRPSRGQHVIQVEIDRSMYMDEATLTPKPEFKLMQTRLRKVIQDLVDIGAGQGRLAAE